MVTDRGAAGKYPLTGQLSLTWRHRLDKLHLQGGGGGGRQGGGEERERGGGEWIITGLNSPPHC